MSLNSRPKNICQTPPDFAKLEEDMGLYPAFRNILGQILGDYEYFGSKKEEIRNQSAGTGKE